MELCFVQFFEILDDKYSKTKLFDSAFHCIGLHWQESKITDRTIAIGKVYALVPVGSLGEKIPPVSTVAFIEIFSGSDLDGDKTSKLVGIEGRWALYIFYLHQYYVAGGEKYDCSEFI